MKKIFFNVILVTLLALYFSLAVTWQYKDPFILKDFLFSFFSVFFIFETLLMFFWNKILNIVKRVHDNKIRKYEYVIYSLFIVLVLIFAMFVFFPSIGNYDGELLWDNFKNGKIDNWNPVPYVYIFIGLPSLISNNIFSTTIFQSVFVFLSTLYLFIYIRRNYLNFSQTLLLLLLFICNPIYIKYSVFVSKDVIYSWSLLFLTLNLMDIIKSNLAWLNKIQNKVFFLFSMIAVLLFRHNGIIPFICTFIYIFVSFKPMRKFAFFSFFAILVSFFILTGPIYRFLNIGGSLGHTEAMGVIMQNISYYHRHSANLTDGDRMFLYNIIPKSVWDQNYDPRNYNHIKLCENSELFDCNYDRETMEKYTGLIIKKWYRLTLKNPDLFIRSYLNITTPIWEVNSRMGEIDYLYWSSPEVIKSKINERFFNIYSNYYAFVINSPLRWMFVTFGEGLAIIILALFISIRKTQFDLKKLLPFIPVITNSLVISLLITGEEYRFVMAQGLCYLPLLLYSLFDVKNKDTITVNNNRKFSVLLISLYNILVSLLITILCFKFQIVKNYVLCFLIIFILFEFFVLLMIIIENKKSYKENIKLLIPVLKDIFINKTNKTCFQFIRYLFVGGIAAIINIGMLYILTDVCNMYYLISNVFSFTFGLITNYILSKRFVFQDAVLLSKKKEFFIYALIGIVGLGLDSILLSFLTSTLKIYYMISKIVSTACVFVWNFGARKILYMIIR